MADKKVPWATTQVEGGNRYLPKCVNTELLCAHSFQEECTATKYKHLCEEMKHRYLANNLTSKVLGN